MADKLDQNFTIRISSRMKFEIEDLAEEHKFLLLARVRETIAKTLYLSKFDATKFGLNSNDTNFFD